MRGVEVPLTKSFLGSIGDSQDLVFLFHYENLSDCGIPDLKQIQIVMSLVMENDINE